MERLIDAALNEWKDKTGRKALLVRGARQVGKTYAVRSLGRTFAHFLEVNFEETPAAAEFFRGSLSPAGICEKLSAYAGVPIIPGETLLFLDEIQACPEALSSLRFFYERMPDLHVASAGSLLELVMEEIPALGVGRIESLFLYPMTFHEFATALGEQRLLAAACQAGPDAPLDGPLHDRLVDLVRTHLLLGGLPEVVQHYVGTRDLNGCGQLIDDLITIFEDDFAKYRRQAPVVRLGEVFRSIPYQAGRKFKYSNVPSESGSREIKTSLELLIKAGLAHRAQHSAAHGVPLGAQAAPKRFKVLPFDLGVHQRLLGLRFDEFLLTEDRALVAQGNLAEVFVGLELVTCMSPRRRPELYYWHREQASANAEVDYVIQKGSHAIPIEVKAGTRGSMQSMRVFLDSHDSPYGLRVSLENFARYGDIKVLPMYAMRSLAPL